MAFSPALPRRNNSRIGDRDGNQISEFFLSSVKVKVDFPWRLETFTRWTTRFGLINNMDKHIFKLTLTGTDSTVPTVQRLRALLKVALRAFGLKCTHVREVKHESEKPTNDR